MEQLTPSPAVLAHRDAWQNRGQERPSFAEDPAPGRRSVWDFPRPPRIVPLGSPARVLLAAQPDSPELAASGAAVEVQETASAPTVYFSPDAVDDRWLEPVTGQSHCEWKGLAESYGLTLAARRYCPQLAAGQAVAWRYRAVYPEFESIADWWAFYPQYLACFVGEERIRAQPGGFYGGWVSADLAGPIKGGPGSGGW